MLAATRHGGTIRLAPLVAAGLVAAVAGGDDV
jgi:hypothetical protein